MKSNALKVSKNGKSQGGATRSENGFNGTAASSRVEDMTMMKDKLVDGENV